MFRRVICTFGVLVAAVMIRLPVQASQTGSIRILPQCGNGSISEGTILLYRVGIPEEGGYRVSDGLADWTIWEKDIQTEDVKSWILKQEYPTGMAASIAPAAGACFSDLAEGLYLVVQEKTQAGYFPFSPMLIQVPEGNTWEIVKFPKVLRDAPIPQTSDRPAPIIGAMGLGFAITLVMIMVDKREK